VAPTFWLRFSSWTAATTAYTASKSRADESWRGRVEEEGEYIMPTHNKIHRKLQKLIASVTCQR